VELTTDREDPVCHDGSAVVTARLRQRRSLAPGRSGVVEVERPVGARWGVAIDEAAEEVQAPPAAYERPPRAGLGQRGPLAPGVARRVVDDHVGDGLPGVPSLEPAGKPDAPSIDCRADGST